MIKRLVLSVALAAALGACGGGGSGSGGGAGAGGGVTATPAADAFLVSVDGVVKEGANETAEGRDVTAVTPTQDDTSDPLPVQTGG